MADEGYGRTFSGDPNAPAKAPTAPSVVPAAQASGEAIEPSPSGSAQVARSRPAKAIFKVVPDDEGQQSVYMMDDSAQTTKLGPVSIGNAQDLLSAVGTYNDVTKSWQVPEDAARQLLKGDLPTPDYILAKYRSNKAMIAQGSVMTEWLRGSVELDDALSRADLEDLKMQVKDAPLFVWQGDVLKTAGKMWSDLKEAGVSGTARRMAGETAGLAAFATDAPMAAAAGMAMLAPIVATKGAAAPLVVPVVAGALRYGADALVFRRSYEIEGGVAAKEMLDKGFDPKSVKDLAPLVGIVNGALEVVGFHMLTAPFKRVAARTVLASPAVKKVLASAYVNYMKELGGEVTAEIAQERVNILAENFAADIENRPDLKVGQVEGWNRSLDAGLAVLAGLPGAKVPGLALEAGVERRDKKLAEKVEGGLKAREAAKQTSAPVVTTQEQATVDSPAAPAAPAAPDTPAATGATPTVDPAGDYLPRQQKAATAMDELVQKTESGKVSPDHAAAEADKIISAVNSEMDASPQNFGEQVAETERKARLSSLRGDLTSTSRLIDSLVQVRERFARNEQSTARLDRQLDTLMEEEASIRADIEFYDKQVPSRVGFEKNETLSMKPATLENIIQVGFKEGRKEVIQVRARQVKDLAAENKLTAADVRLLLRDKNIGLMGDVEFRHFLDGFEKEGGERAPGFREKVAAHVERKGARNEVRKVLKDRAVKGEKNIRALHELPAVNKMTTKQLKDYVKILSEYDPGEIAMTPKRVGALKGTVLEGATTFQEVLTKAAKNIKTSVASLLESSRGQFDTLRGDTELSEANAAYNFAVTQVQTEEAIAAAAMQEFERANYRLGSAALNSRAKMFSLRRLIPSMPEVMKWLETDPGEVYAGAAMPELTPEEEAYVDFLRDFRELARDYLVQSGALESTRFEQTYAPHMRRSPVEVLRDVKNNGVKDALDEFYSRLTAVQDGLLGSESGGAGLGLKKHFKFAEFRSGDLKPSDNVIRIFNTYAQQFFRKQALDKSVTVVDTVVLALGAVEKDQTEEGQQAWKALGSFIKDYLNNKKGINKSADAFAPRGGVVDAALRIVSGWISLAYIGGNAALQLTAPIGETASLVPVLAGERKGSGLWGLALANKRLMSDQGKKIVEKYESFTGKGAIAEVLEAGKSADERAGAILYGLLQWGRTRSLKTLLLGMMTEAEFNAGEIAPERLAEIKKIAGRWMDLHGMKSVAGSTSLGTSFTKFRGWVFPILRTTLQDVSGLLNSLGAKAGDNAAGDLLKLMGKGVGLGNDKPLNARQAAELYGIVEVTLVASAIGLSLGAIDEDDDTFAGMLKKRILSEMFSLTQVFNPKMLLFAGVTASFLTQLGKNLEMLLTLEEYQRGPREGQLKGPSALAKQLPFSAAARNVISMTKSKGEE